MEKTIYVYENWSSSVPTLLGCLYVDDSKRKESYAFEYHVDWLKNNDSIILDPDLFSFCCERRI